MKKLCIIPARGGSKRIPNKNFKEFLGKPIIAYSIETALNSEIFDEVMVSTDSEKIAEVATKYGAKIPFMRSAKAADDFATTAEVIKEVIEQYSKQKKEEYDLICCLYPTAPFVTKELLQKAFQKLQDKKYDAVFPVVAFQSPVQRAIMIREDKLSLMMPEYMNSRSQDLETVYHDAGQFYWLRPEKTVALNKMWTENTGVIEVSDLSAQDIDTETDWKMAELKYKYFNELT
ncbi:MAG: pseudaminic acid cytidylyltransferase [Crocinitomicaceae bacterium]